MSDTLVKKYFQCDKCKQLQSQAVHRNQFQVKCSSCGAFLNEIPENEFNILQRVTKNRNEDNKINDDSPIMPPEDVFRNPSSLYNRPPSNIRNNDEYQEENRNRFNNINDERSRRNRTFRRYRDFNYNEYDNELNNRRRNNRRHQSTNHYSDMNIINDSIDSNDNDNDNDNNDNNINNINNINNEFGNNEEEENESQERERNYQRWPNFGARNRGRSIDPMNSSFSDNFFNNFFGVPLIPLNTHPVFISHNEDQPFRVFVQRQNVPQFIFDPMFSVFGSMFNDNFRNNYSSNFRSNFRGNFLNEILRILERNQDEAARRAHPPTSESALKKLKRFPLSDKYCKKDKNGKIELPSCCICLNDVQKGEETVLLPCGHMFHWNCCFNWLKNNNTCPLCRFEIKD